MQKLMLNTVWTMQRCGDTASYHCTVPCSVYDTLVTHGAIESPYYRENEREAFTLSEEDYVFSTTFPSPAEPTAHMALCFDGIDTIADITLNGELLGHTDNMHRRWRFDVSDKLRDENTLEVKLYSPLAYIAKKQKEHKLWGQKDTVPGFPHLRKAHYMFGWDWGPKLPDLGIWRDVYLELWDAGRVEAVQYTQEHTDGAVNLTVRPQFDAAENGMQWAFALYDPDGERIIKTELMPATRKTLTVRVSNPKLWWAHGYGDPDLYSAVVLLTDKNGDPADSRTERIGLRKITIQQVPDKWGESFNIRLNDKDIFAMGANWTPCDNMLPRCTPEKQQQLLQSCLDANFNTIRVWGGGFYPDDAFLDFCDENGLILWQDFMFACANYPLDDEFWATTEAEIRDNLLRLRNHACLGLWCGNNEIETSFETWGLPEDPQAKADYLELFEKRIPAIVKELDPEHFYWRSSPSTKGGCKDTCSNDAGDMHYWEVWHGRAPFTDFRKHFFRFCSEYGFESVPSLRTMRTVCDERMGDLNLFSPVMEMHHKCDGGSEKLMHYLAQNMRYPENFDELTIATQYLQAEYLRSNVEHMRRHRGHCMGSLWWQLSDSNPCISWSTIDYCGRWKAAQYYAKRFHAPVLLSAGLYGVPKFNISNETLEDFTGTIVWEMRNVESAIVTCGSIKAEVPALSAKFFKLLDELKEYYEEENRRTHYLSYRLENAAGEVVSSGVSLLCPPKQFEHPKPTIKLEMRKLPEHYIITVTSDTFVPAAVLECKTVDIPFSDNWFPLNAGEPVNVFVPRRADLNLDVLRAEITVRG